jgi:CRISPR-associated protein Cmr2
VVYDLAERVLAAAKSTHAFDQLKQTGWRDSLTGETEWLSVSKEALRRTPGQRDDSLWARVKRNKPAWAKEREHLGALSAIKRLWPTIFAEEVGDALGATLPRFVVSTHTMALAHQLEGWLERGAPMTEELRKELEGAEPVALPRSLMRFSNHRDFELAKRLADLLERSDDLDETRAPRLRRLVSRALASGEKAEESAGIETYYALLMMDGDEMGRGCPVLRTMPRIATASIQWSDPSSIRERLETSYWINTANNRGRYRRTGILRSPRRSTTSRCMRCPRSSSASTRAE